MARGLFRQRGIQNRIVKGMPKAVTDGLAEVAVSAYQAAGLRDVCLAVRDLVVVLRLSQHRGFRFDICHAVLRKIAARGDQQLLVFRGRVEQGFV